MNDKLVLNGLVCFLLLVGCRDISVVGEDFIEGTDYELALTNSTPLEFSTIRFDSLVTSESDRLLIGGQKDTEFGDFQMESYFQFDLLNPESRFREGLEYDSVSMSISFDGYTLYLDERIVTETIVVERLINELTYLEDQSELYNYSSISGATDVPGVPLGEKEFFIATDRIRELEVRLDDEFGRDLFHRLENDDEVFSDDEEARQYLKGFRVYLKQPTFLIGITTEDVRLTIHTTDINSTSLSNVEISFSIGFTPYYTKYIHENIPEDLDVVDQEEKISSESMDNRSLIVGGLGYATQIEVTDVRNLLLDGDDFILVNAELRLAWLDQPHEDYSTGLRAQLIDEDFIDLTRQTFSFRTEIDDEYGRDNFYVLDATSIVDFIINEPIGAEYYLLITTENFTETPTSIVLGDGSLDSELNIYTIKN